MKRLLAALVRIRRKQSWIFAASGLVPLFMLAHFGHHLVNALPIPLLPMICEDFGLDYTQAGLLVAAFTVTYGFSQFPAGWLADRWGARNLLTIGISGVALAGLMVGLSQDYHLMLLWFAVMGIAGGGYHPAAPPLIAAVVSPENRGRAMGFHMVGGSAPFFLAPLIAVALAAVWGWRGAFIALAIPTIFLGALFYRLLGRYLKGARADVAAVPSAASSAGSAAVSLAGKEEAPKGHGYGKLVPFIVLATFTHALVYCVIAFIPLFLVDRFGLSKEAAAAFVAIFYSAGLWASLLGGSLADRMGSVPVVLAVCLVSGVSIYLLHWMPGAFGIACLMFVMGICNYIRTPVSETYLVGQTTDGNRSTVLGIYYFSNYEGGGVLTPVMGYLIDRQGFNFSFSLAGVVLLLTILICWIWLRRVDKTHNPPPDRAIP